MDSLPGPEINCSNANVDVTPQLQLPDGNVPVITAMFEMKKIDTIPPSNFNVNYDRKFYTLPRKLMRHRDTVDSEQQTSVKQLNNQDASIDNRPNNLSPAKPQRLKPTDNIGFGDNRHLISAAREGNMDVVQWLIKHGVDTKITDVKGRNALLAAACTGKFGVFKFLLQISEVNQKDVNGWNCLHIGVVGGHQRIVKESIKHVSIDSRSGSGLTALNLAANLNQMHMVEYLLNAGADPMIASVNGWTPLHFAARNKNNLILYILLESDKGKNLLNFRTSEGMTPLSLAVQSESLECVRLLLDAGANPNPIDNKGWTPARIAAINNFRDIASYLANYKATL